MLHEIWKKYNCSSVKSHAESSKPQQFEVVLSMPFTSTAVIADYYGKDSIYYDPSRKIQKDDRAAHNLTVINGKIELKNYLYNIFNIQ